MRGKQLSKDIKMVAPKRSSAFKKWFMAAATGLMLLTSSCSGESDGGQNNNVAETNNGNNSMNNKDTNNNSNMNNVPGDDPFDDVTHYSEEYRDQVTPITMGDVEGHVLEIDEHGLSGGEGRYYMYNALDQDNNLLGTQSLDYSLRGNIHAYYFSWGRADSYPLVYNGKYEIEFNCNLCHTFPDGCQSNYNGVLSNYQMSTTGTFYYGISILMSGSTVHLPPAYSITTPIYALSGMGYFKVLKDKPFSGKYGPYIVEIDMNNLDGCTDINEDNFRIIHYWSGRNLIKNEELIPEDASIDIIKRYRLIDDQIVDVYYAGEDSMRCNYLFINNPIKLDGQPHEIDYGTFKMVITGEVMHELEASPTTITKIKFISQKIEN